MPNTESYYAGMLSALTQIRSALNDACDSNSWEQAFDSLTAIQDKVKSKLEPKRNYHIDYWYGERAFDDDVKNEFTAEFYGCHTDNHGWCVNNSTKDEAISAAKQFLEAHPECRVQIWHSFEDDQGHIEFRTVFDSKYAA